MASEGPSTSAMGVGNAAANDGNHGTIEQREVIKPQVLQYAIPFVGQNFVDPAQARQFYNEYAKLAGFSIRMNQMHTLASTGEITWRRMVCSREGKHNKPKQSYASTSCGQKMKRNRVSSRCGCMARLEILRSSTGVWNVSRFIEEHNHAMSTDKESEFLRSHRAIDRNSMTLLDSCNDVGIGPSAAFNLVAEMRKGKGITFVRTDVKNRVSRSRRRLLANDAEHALVYLQRRQDKNPKTFFAVRKDDKGTLMSLFWADGRSRLDFKAFHDVICFDTTYRTNKYQMPFAPFVGLNHHKQTVVFGCGLISDETTDSFLWLFRKFKEAMGGQSPTAIITDQDSAIEAAIEVVFPAAVHKYCLWHIMRKVPEKLGKYFSVHDGLEGSFNGLVYNDVSTQDFDANWGRLIELYDLQDNDWLAMLFARRSKWAPIYHKTVRFFGMCTNQRSEGFHAFVDHYTSRRTSLLEFVIQIDRALNRRRKDEISKDSHTCSAVLERRTSFPLEDFFFKTYTYTNFKDIQQQMWESNAFSVDIVGEDDEEIFYDVVQPNDRYDSRAVQYNPTTNYGKCSCMLFESAGIICRHLFAVFWLLKISRVPQFFVLKRLSREPRIGLIVDALDAHNIGVPRIEDLSIILNSITAVTATHPKLLYHAIERSNRVLNELEDLKEVYEEGGDTIDEVEPPSTQGAMEHEMGYNANDETKSAEYTKNPTVVHGRGSRKTASKKRNRQWRKKSNNA